MSSTIHGLRIIASSQIGAALRGLKAMAAGARQLRNQWKTAAKDMASSAAKITMVIGAIGLISATTFGKFEQTMTRVGAVTKTLGTRDFAALEKAARDAGRTTKFSATQSAEAMENLGLAGLKTNEIIKALPGTLQLASAAQLSIAQAADIAAKTMRAYGMEAEELTRINDTLVATFTTSNTDLVQLAEALKPVGPLAKTLNVSLEETSAVLAKLADQGYQGSLGGTALRNIMAKLAGAAPEVTNKLRKMGIETLDASGNMRPLFDILQEIEAAGLSGGKIMELFGARGGPQMAALLATGTAELRRYTKELEANKGIAQKLEESNLKTLAGRFAILKSSIEDVVISVGERLNPALLESISTLEKFIDEHRPEIVDRLSEAVVGLSGYISRLIQWFNEASPSIGQAYAMMQQFMGPIMDFIAAHPGILAAMLALKAASSLGITQAIISLTAALAGSVRMLWTFYTWMITNVNGALFAQRAFIAFRYAVLALQTVLGVGVIIALAWALKEVATWAQKNFGVFNPLIDIWNELKSIATDLWNVFSSELGPVFEEIGQVITNDLMPAINAVWSELKKELMPVVKELASQVAAALGPQLKSLAEFMKAMIPDVARMIRVFGDLAVTISVALAPTIGKLIKFGFWLLEKAITAALTAVEQSIKWYTMLAKVVSGTLTPVLKALGIEMDKNLDRLEKEIDLLKEKKGLEKDSVDNAKKRADVLGDAANDEFSNEDKLKILLAKRRHILQQINQLHESYNRGDLGIKEYKDMVNQMADSLDIIENELDATEARMKKASSPQAGNGNRSPAEFAAATAEDGEAAPIQAQVDPNEIANILRDAQRDKRDQSSPGYAKIRDFIDLGPTREQFTQFLGTIEGATPRIQESISDLYDFFIQDGELTVQEMEQLSTAAAVLIRNRNEYEEQQKQKQEELKQSLQSLGQRMIELKGTVPNEVLNGLAGKFMTLREQFRSGQISLEQYQAGVSALTKETQKAADAAKAAAAAEERKRLIQGKFTKKEFQTALEDRIIAFRQQQFSNAVEQSFNALFGFNQQMGAATNGFRSLRDGMSGFGDRISSIGSGISQSVEQQIGTLRDFFSSAQGQAANIRNQIEQLRQNMTLVDTYSARQRIQEMIDGLFNQLNNIIQTPPPTFVGVSGSNFKDPGLQSVQNQNNKFELNFPNINKLTNNDINNIYDMLQQEQQRRGGPFSV